MIANRPRRKEYRLAGIHFPTQTLLEAAVKERLATAPRDVEFNDQLLEAIINELHGDVVLAALRVTRLAYLTSRGQARFGINLGERFKWGQPVMAGHFAPLNEWHDVTVYPWKLASPEADFKAALRCKCADFILRPSLLDRCSVAGCTLNDLDYHHETPTFNEMAEAAIKLATPYEIDSRFGYRKFEKLNGKRTLTMVDWIPDEHPSVMFIRRQHECNKWIWLCKAHHKEVTKNACRNKTD